ncbi:helix-turn-helix domain-containing protein, partial [Escherichia coli]|uniref:helix-turn-helix domain-containing protein n=1 Tax=Escherichia coli TaxID=562 RepID=UPI003CE4883B
KRITTKLREGIDRDVGLSELAELVGLSETYLCTAFRNASGLPPHQWQKQARVERAKELLASSALSVTEVALEVGYSNPGHFAT